jgi:hypothetical protein
MFGKKSNGVANHGGELRIEDVVIDGGGPQSGDVPVEDLPDGGTIRNTGIASYGGRTIIRGSAIGNGARIDNDE